MNRLKGQTSPYLRQHAENPVAWQPWDAEALATARREGKPILLSIGYSACHWCHVMAHESFEDEAVARLMNEHFVNVKVDREERPDLDRIYQTAHQLLTRNRGGWPLTMFLDPNDHLPFFGGTYFPPQARHGLPGFSDVLAGIAAAYAKQTTQIEEFKSQLREALAQNLGRTAPSTINAELVDRACGQLNESFDDVRGGFGAAPKFPHPAGLSLLLDAAACTDDAEICKRLLYMVDFTLAAMSCGGLYDHLGGGFFRYSVDADWNIPHFEKMLYDNGPLLSLYVRRARLTGAAWFGEVAAQTAGWIGREMQLENGGVCSSLDADSEGVEGRYYVWTAAAAEAILGDEFATFAARFGLSGPANFDGEWHLRLAPPDTRLNDPSQNPTADLAAARQRLLAARTQRERPARDDKILTSWNALTARALAEFGQHMGRPDCIDAAVRVVDYLRQSHWVGGRLLATSKDGVAHLNAYLDDYVFLIDALLVLLAARWCKAHLDFALALTETLLDHYEDRQNGGFFFTSDDHETLIQRSKSFGDDSLPAGNGVAASVLLELGHLVGDMRYLSAAERTLKAAMTDAARAPSAHATIMSALLDYTMPPPRVILRHAEDVDVKDWLALAKTKLSERSRCYTIPENALELAGILNERRALSGAAITAYVCSGHQCQPPATTLAGFASAIDG